jgi:alanine dehydrogenase
MTANIARTASRALSNALLPTIKDIVRKGLSQAIIEDPGLAAGLYLYRGHMVNEKVAALLETKTEPLADLIQRG